MSCPLRAPGWSPSWAARSATFRPPRGATFLADLARGMAPGETLLLGLDLVKDAGRLVAAYDDSAGVTAAFNTNVLHGLNRELGADFDVAAFEHVAVWDAENEWVEMRLRATRPMPFGSRPST
jgi:L-histidine N-alpha-methyltransferase